MSFDLKATRKEYEMADESGYRYKILAERDPEWGWSATVTMVASGSDSAVNAIKHLRHAAEHFLRQLKELE